MKDENLLIAKERGIHVPDFIIIQFQDIFFGASEVEKVLEHADFSDVVSLSKQLQSIVRQYSHYDSNIELAGDIFAVRSASNAEDGEQSSFAGQFDTFLDVARYDVPEKIIACVESLFSEHALMCAAEHSIDVRTLKMNVMVQRMLSPSLSGILFTANPQGLLNESVIVVGKGKGDNIVSDRALTTSYYYSLTDCLYYYEGREELLSREQVEELIHLSEMMKDIFEEELLDIEFAVENGQIYILQVRRITTLHTDTPVVFDNSNIVESYPGISLPLTDSFVCFVYTGVFRGVAMRVLKNKDVISRYEESFRNMVGSANGRMYYKISNWYTIIKFLPFSKKIIPVWQEMLGVKTKNYDHAKVDITLFTRVCTYVNAAYELLTVPRSMRKLEDTFSFVQTKFYQTFEKELTNRELVALYEEIRDKLLKVWDVTLLNDMYAFIFTGLIKARLKKREPQDYERIAGEFLSGISNIESMKPVRALAELARLSQEDTNTTQFRKKYEDYIMLYGDRYLEELKLESRTFRTDHDLLNQKIEEYAKDSDRLNRLLFTDQETKKVIKKHGVFMTLCVKAAVRGIRNREISRLNRSRVYGMVRSIFLRLADDFVKSNMLENGRDIFYLTVDEAFSLVEEEKDMRGTVLRRKQEYEMYRQLPAYSRLVFFEQEFSKSHVSINSVLLSFEAGQLRGTPCSNGIVEGEVLKVTDVNAIGDVTGKILVTKMTDPGWVFLLSGAAGIIAERGSLLSHTAIVSREIGIPSVVGVDNVMNILNNGDRVSMDGGSGMIEILR